MKSWNYLILLLPLLIGINAFGQDATFTAAVSKTTIALNENFQLTFTLQNGSIKLFKPPVLSDYEIISGPNVGTKTIMLNGITSNTTSYTYILQPRKVGKFTIGTATIDAGGKIYNSNKIPIEVVANATSKQPGKNNGKKNTPQTIEEQIKDGLILKAIADKTEVYQGEQVTVTYRIYRQFPIYRTQTSKEPSYNGFWKQEVEIANELDYKPDAINGRRFESALYKRVAIFPQRSGDIDIESMKLSTNIKVESMDFFHSADLYPYEFESNGLKIKVKPLPTTDKPLDFNGFVGNLGMEVVLDKKEAKTDDPLTLSLRFKGVGNLKVIEPPKLDLSGDFDVFDAKLNDKPATGGTVGGERIYDYLIIPRRPGTYKIPSISISYFDPATQNYKTLKSAEFTVTITGQPSKSSGTQNYNGVNKEDVQLLGQDIRYIRNNGGGLHTKQGYFFGSWMFAGLYTTPFALFFILLAFRRRKEQMDSDTVRVRVRGASKGATKRLKEAKARMEEEDSKCFYDELIKAVWGYLGDKLNIEPSVLSHDSARETLIAREVSPELTRRLFKFIGDSEMALYAPGAIGVTLQTHYNEAKEIIDQLEEELGK